MTYEETVNLIQGVVTKYTNVQTFWYGSPLLLNKQRDIKYPVIVLSPRVMSPTVSGVYHFNFTLWYVDIQARDRRNVLSIHSKAIEVLEGINNAILETPFVMNTKASTSVFYDRFNDICAGGVCDLLVQTKAPVCPPEEVEPEPEK